MARATLAICLVILMQALSLASAAAQTPVKARLTGLRQVVEECRLQTGAVEADFEALVRKEVANSYAAKCLRACMMKRFNLMDESGKFNKQVAMRIASEAVAGDAAKLRIAEDIVDICIELPVSHDHCEAAEQYGKCASDQGTARGFA